MVTVCLIFGACVIEGVEYRSFIYNLQFACSRIPSFILGMYAGQYALNHYSIKYPLLSCVVISLIACAMKYYVPTLTISCFMAIPMMYILILLLSKETNSINRILSFMGDISLESYLFNGILPFYIVNQTCFFYGINVFHGNYIPYLIVILLGTLLSYIVHHLSVKIDLHKG